MNRSKLKKLLGVLSELNEDNPDIEFAVYPRQDGARVTVNGPRVACGASGPCTGSVVEIRMADDGPLARFLLNGHL